MGKKAIVIENLSKTFGDVTAIEHLDLAVEEGELFGLLGPNGAGKSTTINILCGLLEPTTGVVRVGGYDVKSEPEQFRELIGVCPQEFAVFPYLTGRENVEFFGNMHSLPKTELNKRVEALLEKMALTEDANRRTKTYSGGMKRRISLIMALVSDPSISFLDEPTTGMDPQSRRAVWDFLNELKHDSRTIVLTTHYMEEAEYLCDRVGIMDQGKLIALGRPADLIKEHGVANLEEVFLKLTGRQIREAAQMNTQRVLAIVRKDLKKCVREPASLFIIMLFPVALTLAFGVSMGGIGGDNPQTYNIGVVDHDSGGPYAFWSTYFTENLTKNPMLSVHDYDSEQTARDDLSQGRLAAVLSIPANFGESCESFRGNPTNQSRWILATVGLSVDKGSMVATQAAGPIVQQILVNTVAGQQASSASLPVTVSSAFLVDAEKRSAFFYMVPGLFAYGVAFIIMVIGQSFTSDREGGLLRRMKKTPLTSSEFMASQVISNMVLTIIQVALIFLVAFAVGYRPDTGTAGLALAFVITTVFSLCCVGLGLITATIARSPGAATGISFVFILPMMFFGTFVSGVASSPLSSTVGKLTPSHYVTDALTSLFSRGAPVSSPSVMMDLIIVSMASLAVLLAGIFLYRRYGSN